MLDEMSNDVERAQALQNLLIAVATGGASSGPDYPTLRAHFINNPNYKALLPSFIRTNRDTSQSRPHLARVCTAPGLLRGQEPKPAGRFGNHCAQGL
jgi:hypothetical protein